MSGFHFAHPVALILLGAAPALAALFRYGDARRRDALAQFGAALSPNRTRAAKRAFIIAAAALMALAIARPMKSVPVPPAASGDVVFLLDVSRSMLSRDAVPNRLRHAGKLIAEMAGRIAARPGGQRLGLIAFAGNAAVLCPLTIDQDYFRETLAGASPESVTRGGSRIGDALRFALSNGFDDVRRGSKDLVLLTDGGDQESNPQQAAQALARSGIRLTVIGIGDPGHTVPVPHSEDDNFPFLYNGAPVLTRLESAELRSIGGAYWEGGPGFDAAAVVRTLAARPNMPDGVAFELYPMLLALAALLLALEPMISERRRPKLAMRAVTAAVALIACALPMRAQSAAEWIRQGNDLFGARQYEAAITCYRNAASILPASPQVQFDLGVAMYKAGFYAAAAPAFAQAADRTRDPKLQAKSLVGEGNTYFRSAPPGNPSQAIRALERAIELYSSALTADPKTPDAAYNLAVAKKKLEELKRQRQAEAAKDYAVSSMRHEKPETSDPNEILKEAKEKSKKQQIPRRAVATDW